MNLKKLLPAAIAGAGLLASASAFADVTITMNSASGAVGSQVDVTYDYAALDADDVGGFQFDMVYNPAELTRRLQGRSYRIRDVSGDRRRVLAEWIDLGRTPADGVILGQLALVVGSGGADSEAVPPWLRSPPTFPKGKKDAKNRT